MEKFANGFVEMTFGGKGAFWIICGALLLIILTYSLSGGLRERMKKGAAVLLLVPVLLLAGFAWHIIGTSKYVPLSERKDGQAAYTWEQTTRKTDVKTRYTTDVKDPNTGKPYEQIYSFTDIRGQMTFKEDSEHVYEEFTIPSDDGSASIVFLPDGTYRLTFTDGAEEGGTYALVDKVLTLTSGSGAEKAALKTKTSKTLKYDPEVQDAEGKAYPGQKFKINDLLKEFFVEENLETVQEEYTAVSEDGTTSITFSPDGTYRFAAEGGAEEKGAYIYRNDVLTMANATGSAAFWKNFMNQIGWLVFAVAVAVILTLVFVFNDKIKVFMNRHPLIWLLIPVALLIYFVYVSIGWNIWVSVSDWGLTGEDKLNPTYGWGGSHWYDMMFRDSSFWEAVLNTLKLFLIIPICLLLGLALALIMDHGLRGTAVFRTLILLPFALSFVVTGLIWQQMYNGQGGILAEFLKLFGVKTDINWLSNEMVMYSIMIVMIWQFSGYVAVIFLAAIKNVPTNIINAAKLDGAYMPRIYRKMIIPQLKGATGSCITILAMYALRSFDLIYSLTGPTNTASTTLPIKMYVEAFSKDNFAFAAAISCFLLALVLVLILPLTYWTNRRKR